LCSGLCLGGIALTEHLLQGLLELVKALEPPLLPSPLLPLGLQVEELEELLMSYYKGGGLLPYSWSERKTP
jgi:hypothetical protein